MKWWVMWFIGVVAAVAVVIIAGKKEGGPVTCGSAIKLQHKETVRSHTLRVILGKLKVTLTTY